MLLTVYYLSPSLSQYEVSSGVRHDSLTDLKRRLKIMAQEKLQVEKLVAKLYAVSSRDGLSVHYTLDGCNHVM